MKCDEKGWFFLFLARFEWSTNDLCLNSSATKIDALFGSLSSSDEDDLFSAKSTTNKTVNPSKPEVAKNPISTSARSNLFEDSDSDDDIFSLASRADKWQRKKFYFSLVKQSTFLVILIVIYDAITWLLIGNVIWIITEYIQWL